MRSLAGTGLVLAMLIGLAAPWASAASPNLYLLGDSVPSASMSSHPPSSGALPNFDPGRDAFPGLVIAKGSGSSGESDPTKYQQWSQPMVGETLDIDELEIWAAPKDFDDGKTIVFNVYVLDCGANCQVLDSASASVSSDDWTRRRVALDVIGHHFAAGNQLRVKVVVDNSSDDDAWFAYATNTYKSRLKTAGSAVSTTTTTAPSTTTTQPASTTTTPPTATTVTTVPGATTLPPGGESSTTTLPQMGGEPTNTTSTTAPGSVTPGAQPPTNAPPSDPGSSGSGRGQPGQVGRAAGLFPITAPPIADDAIVVLAASDVRALRPQEGLMVAFNTAAEAIRIYWVAALALGTLASILLLMGSRRDHEDDWLTTTTVIPPQIYDGWDRMSDPED